MGSRKRHKAWSNSPEVRFLNRGKLTKEQRESCVVTTTTKKKVGNKTTYAGNKFLKGTQSYPIAFGLRMLRLLPRLCLTAAGQPVVAAADAPSVFFETPWGDCWPEANVLQACIYMRGSFHLRASSRWKVVFPESYPLK